MKSVACSLLAVASLFASVSAQGSCSSDGNADGVVNVTDLLGLLAQYGGAGSYDTDGDGDVDVTDLLALLAQFGTTGCTSGGGGGGGGGTFSVTGDLKPLKTAFRLRTPIRTELCSCGRP